jgi:hypothetical protein
MNRKEKIYGKIEDAQGKSLMEVCQVLNSECLTVPMRDENDGETEDRSRHHFGYVGFGLAVVEKVEGV